MVNQKAAVNLDSFPDKRTAAEWESRKYDEEKYWGDFDKNHVTKADSSHWLLRFEKYKDNPIFEPSADAWDCGRFGGGVHNGSVIKKDELFYYIYRGEMPYKEVHGRDAEGLIDYFNYICDIGIAVSKDGIHFERDVIHSPLFRKGGYEKFSYEDVNCVKYEDTYYLFCNQWNWENLRDFSENGVFLATSKDLLHWERRGLVFPEAKTVHRNACVLQDINNNAVKINGKFVMYMNHGLIAFSDDLIHWSSETVEEGWPGGEGCLAICDYSKHDKDILLFTGGHHSGHFYAVGEVLFHKDNPKKPIDWLNHPVIVADENIPYESGFAKDDPHRPVSSWRDTIFFTGLTQVDHSLYVYYGGGEYYTCLATVELKK